MDHLEKVIKPKRKPLNNSYLLTTVKHNLAAVLNATSPVAKGCGGHRRWDYECKCLPRGGQVVPSKCGDHVKVESRGWRRWRRRHESGVSEGKVRSLCWCRVVGDVVDQLGVRYSKWHSLCTGVDLKCWKTMEFSISYQWTFFLNW